MKLKKDDLGVVGIVVEDWDITKSFKPKTITTDYSSWICYISRRAVPANTPITNSYYWKPIVRLEPQVSFDYNAFKRTIETIVESFIRTASGGQAFSDDFGDSEVMGITQKTLTIFRDNIQQQIDELKGTKAVVSLIVNPQLIEVGQVTTISFSATSDETASLIEVFAAGELIKSGENIKTLNGTIGNHFITGQSGELEVVANFTYPNASKSASVVVTSVLPIYYGSGEGYAAASNKAPLSTTPAGIYQVDVPIANKYVYFVIPDDMTIHGAKMGGFDFPLEAPEPITRGGKPYKGYRSCNTYNVGTLTIEIL